MSGLARVVAVEDVKPSMKVKLPTGREFPVVNIEAYEPDEHSPGGLVVVYATGRMSRGKPEEGFAPERIHRSLAIRQAGDPVQVAA